MAHQIHNIPWTTLSSNFHWVPSSSCKCRRTNLHPRMRPNQGKELNYFVKGFVRNLRDHTITERKKYPQTYTAPRKDEILLDDELVRKISPTVRRWRNACKAEADYSCGGKICQQGEGQKCRCPDIPYEERRMSAFTKKWELSSCYQFMNVNKAAFFNGELVKTLILYGDMDVLLRACAHPRVGIESWWSAGPCYDSYPDLGWDQIYKAALSAYICLNVLYCFPHVWDKASRETEEKSYRDTKCYQNLLKICTGFGGKSEVGTYPHRQFFGIGDDQLRKSCTPIRKEGHWLRYSEYYNPKAGYMQGPYYRSIHAYGLVPIGEFLTLEKPAEHQPDAEDFFAVQGMLCHDLKLPAELAMDIMELAGFEPKRRLTVPHDPFHPENRDQLGRYLTYCWKLLIRCNMLAEELGIRIRWHEDVSECIVQLWGTDGCGGTKRWYKPEDPDDESEFDPGNGFVYPGHNPSKYGC
ncbi:hypothetical protein FQN54_008411 [Arachnomyces sp. PD_36]|nr:hypothetical protein FQN54_008411 [Arachnomyces sp. PD_36]